MERAQISFMLGSTYDQLPTPANLAHWKVAGSDKCRGGLLSKRHIGACSFQLRTESKQIYEEA